MKNNLLGNNSRVDEAKNPINSLEPKEANNNQSEQQEEKRIPPPTKNTKDSISSLWDNFKRSNICIIEVPEEEEKEQEIGNLFEKIMKENFPNLEEEIDM